MSNTEKSMSIAEINKIRKSETASPKQIEEASGKYLDYAKEHLGSILTNRPPTDNNFSRKIDIRREEESDAAIANSIEGTIKRYLEYTDSAGYHKATANQKQKGFEPEELVQMVEGWREDGVNPDAAGITGGQFVANISIASAITFSAFLADNALDNLADKITDKTDQKPKTELVTKALESRLGLDKSVTELDNGDLVIKVDKIPKKILESLKEGGKLNHTERATKSSGEGRQLGSR